ncbi:hypothetical protein [Nocardioides dongxiaopingii]|nr:hypothetical protein [Nocardioides dongxiaopingii]
MATGKHKRPNPDPFWGQTGRVVDHYWWLFVVLVVVGIVVLSAVTSN